MSLEIKEEYGDPIKMRLGAEFWHIVDDLQPKVLAGVEYITENKSIDETWVETLEEVGTLSLELKYAIQGFKGLLTKEDADSVRPYSECLKLAEKREGRMEVPHDQMEGRAESLAKRVLKYEDRAIALYNQVLDIRAVAFKRKMWDLSHSPPTVKHGVKLS